MESPAQFLSRPVHNFHSHKWNWNKELHYSVLLFGQATIIFRKEKHTGSKADQKVAAHIQTTFTWPKAKRGKQAENKQGGKSKIFKNNKFRHLSPCNIIERDLNWENKVLVLNFSLTGSLSVGNRGISEFQFPHLQNGHILFFCLKGQL